MRAALLLLILACPSPSDTTSPDNPGATPGTNAGPNSGKAGASGPQGPAPGQPGGPPLPEGGMPGFAPGGPEGPGVPGNIQSAGASPQEDLSDSWREELAEAVPSVSDASDCPDADGDGFVSALACPGGDPSQLDCDDQDPNVTPDTERWVRPGPFIMGSASDHAGFDEQPVHVVTLSGYCMDRTEVTSNDFSQWLITTGHTPEVDGIDGVQPNGSVEVGRENKPIEGVSWAEARDYCRSLGKQLPTEAQWEKAARGGCEGGQDPSKCDAEDLVPYPWGSDIPSCTLANHNISVTLPPTLCTSDTISAGESGTNTGPYGHQNLAGNVWEYVADVYHPMIYSSGSRPKDPLGPAPSESDHHVLRGGSWNTFSTNMRAANRFSDMVMGSAVGIRCARPSAQTGGQNYDSIPPMEMVTLSGTISREGGAALTGRALYVTAFDSTDADPSTGMLTPGRSPMAEARIVPSGSTTQTFELQVFKGRNYLLQSSLDNGTGNNKAEYLSASGSGGFGESNRNPILATRDISGLTIELKMPPTAVGGPNGP